MFSISLKDLVLWVVLGSLCVVGIHAYFGLEKDINHLGGAMNFLMQSQR